jgi:hypothetical protein
MSGRHTLHAADGCDVDSLGASFGAPPATGDD